VLLLAGLRVFLLCSLGVFLLIGMVALGVELEFMHGIAWNGDGMGKSLAF
jgi:hypothetical protein